MDTQGAFDSISTVKECATVFALSTMISSIQVYNLSSNIQEDDLQHLELFAEYGRLAVENAREAPFQKLVFLVRDWSYPYEAPYGEDGGRTLLEKRLQVSEDQHPQLQRLRTHLQSCFSDVTCFLMPHPGFAASSTAEFDGRLSDLRAEFKEQLDIFLNMILAPENLILKRIGGHLVKVKDLISYFKTYIKVFQGNQLPEPVSVLEATADANNLAAIVHSRELYDARMEALCGGNLPYISPELLNSSHDRNRTAAVMEFIDAPKMGDENLRNVYLSRLQQEIDERYQSYIRFNESKQLVNAARTPGTLLMIVVIGYVIVYIASSLGFNSIVNSCKFLIGISLLLLGIWCYIRYSGIWPIAGAYIDVTIYFLWVKILYPLAGQCKRASLICTYPALRNASVADSPVRVIPRPSRS